MLRSILLITFRKILKNPSYSFITIFGLTIGLTTAILVFALAKYEFTFDRYDPSNERVHWVLVNELQEGTIETLDETHAQLMENLSFQIPEVEAVTRFDNTRAQIRFESTELLKHGAYADSSYFRVFSPSVIAGSIDNPLPDNHSIAISESISKLLFGNENPIGKVVTVSVKNDFQVSAVFADFPENSSLHNYSFILPIMQKFVMRTTGRFFSSNFMMLIQKQLSRIRLMQRFILSLATKIRIHYYFHLPIGAFTGALKMEKYREGGSPTL